MTTSLFTLEQMGVMYKVELNSHRHIILAVKQEGKHANEQEMVEGSCKGRPG
jgi:hypothetical protein